MKIKYYLTFITLFGLLLSCQSLIAMQQQNNEKLRVFMTSEFPPIGVVKGGDVPLNQKNGPDDMQSMVRFLLYANEFDVEGLVASAGTFAMTSEKKNILELLDQYEQEFKALANRCIIPKSK